MMKASAGMQVNLDVADAAGAARTLRLALSVSSVATALFAKSPLSEGRDNGWASRRARIWTEVDPDRCGIPESLLDPGADLRDYVDWALDAGMFFIERGQHLVDMTGVSFRRFLDEGAAGNRATLADWDLHLTTLFPEARLKPYLEIRGSDSNGLDRMMACAALWKGLVYGGDDVQGEVVALTSGWTRAERIAFHEDCARRGLRAAAPGGRSARELAAELLVLAETGLIGADAGDDCALLEPARELVDAGRSPAEEVLEAWRGPWQRSVVAAARGLDPA
jgi:glutamate--cysteine ligase